MNPEKLEEVGAALEGEIAELRALAPQVSKRDDKLEIGWVARRGRRLQMTLEHRRSGPVLVLSIWAETEFGEAYPVRDGQVELGAQQLPLLASLLAKAIRLIRDGVGERLAVAHSRRVGGDR